MKIKRLKEEEISLINVLCAGGALYRIKVISILKRLREIDTQIREKKRKKHSPASALKTKECLDYYDEWSKGFHSKIHAVTIKEATVPKHLLRTDLPDLKTEEVVEFEINIGHQFKMNNQLYEYIHINCGHGADNIKIKARRINDK